MSKLEKWTPVLTKSKIEELHYPIYAELFERQLYQDANPSSDDVAHFTKFSLPLMISVIKVMIDKKIKIIPIDKEIILANGLTTRRERIGPDFNQIQISSSNLLNTIADEVAKDLIAKAVRNNEYMPTIMFLKSNITAANDTEEKYLMTEFYQN